MSFTTASVILDRATIQLMDDKNIRWTRSELLSWVNEGQKQIVMMAPSATATVKVVDLIKGTRQRLPDDGWMLLDVYRNVLDEKGDAYGRVVKETSRSMLDRFAPNWHVDNPNTEVDSYIYSLQDKRAFWVYPPNTGAGKIEINYSRNPAEIKQDSDVLTISDLYSAALVDYVLYRACSKDAEYAPGLQLAGTYLQTFGAVVMGKSATEMSNEPETEKTKMRRGVVT